MTTLNTAIASTQQIVLAMQKHIHCLFMAIEVPRQDMMGVAGMIEESETTTDLETLFKIAGKLETYPMDQAVFAAEQKQMKGLTSLRTF